jgi:hypothetical protein
LNLWSSCLGLPSSGIGLSSAAITGMYLHVWLELLLYYSWTFCFFGSSRVGTQGFVLARQVLYHLSHATYFLCFSYFFQIRVSFILWLAWIAVLLFILPT